MTFTYPKADKETTIKTVEVIGINEDVYKISYFNGECNTYQTDDPSELQEIYKVMYEQAVLRDCYMNTEILSVEATISSLGIILSTMLLFNTKDTVFVIFVILCLKLFLTKIKQIKELKKYQEFLGIYDDLNTKDPVELNKKLRLLGVEPNLNISTVDNYSIDEIKLIRKYIKN